MNRRTFTPTVAGLAAVLVLASACSTAAPPAFTRAPVSPGLPKPAQTPAASPVMLGDVADLLVLRMARPTSNAAYTVIEPGEGRILFDLADGIVSRDWHTLVSLAPDGTSTRIQVTTPEGGDLPRHVSVPGAWRLPTIGVARQPVGLSADGTTLVLEEAIDPVPASRPGRPGPASSSSIRPGRRRPASSPSTVRSCSTSCRPTGAFCTCSNTPAQPIRPTTWCAGSMSRPERSRTARSSTSATSMSR